jgi:DtxR family manganese transport transcriptional regulator
MTRQRPAGQGPQRKRTATRSAETQAAALRRTRLEHAAETAQDYAEAIADLSSVYSEARAVDLARRLGVSHVTVIRTIARLQRDGYVSTRPYRSIFLTDKGRRLAEESRRRHEIVVAFLRSLGVPEEIAQTDAEGIEHHVSPETLAAFKRYTAART